MEVTLETSDSHDDDNTDEDNPITPTWRFNVFLDQIGQDIMDGDLARMKSLCVGGVFGQSALSKATTPVLFFKLLRDMDFLNIDNLTHLQAMLWHIGRKDLHERMVEFARECRKIPLHFFSPKEKPANGYTHVKFHVRGPNVSRQQMEHIRADVANLLCVKSQDVLLVGYSPSNSRILTFMVPEAAVGVLKTLTKEDKEMFATMKVDSIMIGDVTIPIEGRQVQMSTSDSERKAFTKIVQERDKLKSHLDRIQCRLVERNDELRKAKENEDLMRRSKDQAVITCLTLLYNHRPVTRIIDSLVSKSALVYFKHCLQQFQAKFPGEMDTIEILLEAKRIAVCKTERDIWNQYEHQRNLVIALQVNQLQMQQTVMMANSHGIHISRPPFAAMPVQEMSEAITVGVGVPASAAQPNVMPFGLQSLISAEAMIIIQAMEEISKIVNKQQKEFILGRLEIEDSKKKNFLEPNEQFLWKLFQMKPRNENALTFMLETIRLLDDRTLEAKVLQKNKEVQEACDESAAAGRQPSMTPQVKFNKGLPKRPVDPSVLKRLQSDPVKLMECLALLQGLADNVEV
ncbi:uncharacterized protein LOC117333019 [Pecten maximus]|uniref:uncharacterized protein LOC117333019 n=1 Tax=Pecten maximus TaxID=6579 RepID=UPI001458C7E3|nr:uncharacterized protein LOC117333019 [Pecten maximus]